MELAGCDWIHVDVMDGRFVPNITIGPLIVDALRPVTDLPLDVHLVLNISVLFINLKIPCTETHSFLTLSKHGR